MYIQIDRHISGQNTIYLLVLDTTRLLAVFQSIFRVFVLSHDLAVEVMCC